MRRYTHFTRYLPLYYSKQMQTVNGDLETRNIVTPDMRRPFNEVSASVTSSNGTKKK